MELLQYMYVCGKPLAQGLAYIGSLINGEESSFWLKILICGFSGLSIDNYKGFPWQASWRKAALHTSDWMYLKWIGVQDSGLSGRSFPSHICSPSPCIFIPKCLYMRPWTQVLFRAYTEASFWEEEEEILETLFSCAFSLLALLSLLPLIPGCIKLLEPFVLAPSTVIRSTRSVLIYLTLTGVLLHKGK